MKIVGGTALASGVVPQGASAQPGEDGAVTSEFVQPNILLIMPDQMRGDALSLERHPVLQTPNIDAIGGRGAHFTRAYTTCPSCIPARRSLLTGQYPYTNGLVGFQNGVPIASPTFPQLLREAGYATVLAGRHMHQSPYEESYGFETQVLGSVYITDDDYAQALEQALPGAGGVRGLGVSFNGWASRPWPYSEHLHPTHWVVTQARREIAECDHDRPLFLAASFYAPHPPLIPPPAYYDRYLRKDLPPAAIGEWAEPPENDGLGLGVESYRCVLRGDALREAQAGYFGLINHIDDQIHWLMAEFRARSAQMGRPWVIVFTSDHGEMLGDHYLFRKCQPYEGSARVPLLIQGSPDLGLRSGLRIDCPVCLEDLMPTFLELAGVGAPGNLDGRSLVPLLRGEDAPPRPWLHSEHAPAYSREQAYHFLTDGKLKYIWRPLNGEEQLFDLENDPGELVNLAAAATHESTLRLWRSRLAEYLVDRPEGFSDGANLIPGRPYPNVPHEPIQS